MRERGEYKVDGISNEQNTMNSETNREHGSCHSNQDEDANNTLLQIQCLEVTKHGGTSISAVGLWDAGSTLCFITFELAKKLQLRGHPVKLEIVTVGGESKQVDSQRYTISVFDKYRELVEFEVLGIEQISTEIERINVNHITRNFKAKEARNLSRPISGSIDLLIGFRYAAYHPVSLEAIGHMLLMTNRFGVIVAGSHPELQEKTRKLVQHATVLFTSIGADDLHNIESLGITCSPSCGSCKCGKCHPGAKNMTLLEEKELKLIKAGLSFNSKSGRWMAEYPWLKDPSSLPENKHVAYARLKSTETRLEKTPLHAEIYKRQMDDMLDRKVARKLSEQELNDFKGPKFYLSHHDVLKPNSHSTAMRIVFNSSARVNGISLNECLAKGPSLLNNIMGILLRFRQEQFAFIGDISKMFHSIDIPLKDQMMHLFLWRNLQTDRKPSTYAMTVVNMGDRPASAIAQTALRETAEQAKEQFPEASDIVIRNSYMDDIPASVESEVDGSKIMDNIDELLLEKGFKIKD